MPQDMPIHVILVLIGDAGEGSRQERGGSAVRRESGVVPLADGGLMMYSTCCERERSVAVDRAPVPACTRH